MVWLKKLIFINQLFCSCFRGNSTVVSNSGKNDIVTGISLGRCVVTVNAANAPFGAERL